MDTQKPHTNTAFGRVYIVAVEEALFFHSPSFLYALYLSLKFLDLPPPSSIVKHIETFPLINH